MFKKIIDLIFPRRCLGCKKVTEDGTALCAKCFSGVHLNQTLFCGKCGLRLAEGSKICHKDFPYILGAAGNYDDEALKNLIRGLKFKYIKDAAVPLAEFLIRYAESLALPLDKFVVIPIPLAARRLHRRGFNQSELIAKIFADHFHLPLDNQSLLRVKNTKPQSETKNLAERRENIKECFSAKKPELLRGKSIILVDDVTTSGATLLEAATILKNAGVRKIMAFTVARA